MLFPWFWHLLMFVGKTFVWPIKLQISMQVFPNCRMPRDVERYIIRGRGLAGRCWKKHHFGQWHNGRHEGCFSFKETYIGDFMRFMKVYLRFFHRVESIFDDEIYFLSLSWFLLFGYMLSWLVGKISQMQISSLRRI